jgi:hypothetical protein
LDSFIGHRQTNGPATESIFAGAGDLVVDVESHSARLHRDVPHSTLAVSPGAGHMVHYAVVEEIVNAINLMDDRTNVRGNTSAGVIVADDGRQPIKGTSCGPS